MGIVIYHSPCLDGHTAAWVASKFNPQPDDEYIPAKYGDAPPDVTGKDVLVVDFSYPRSVMEEMKAKAKSLVVLDHHKSAEADCAGLDFCQFDMNRSGAGMAWDFLFAGKPRPKLVNYIEDRDLWKFALPGSRAASAYISSFEKTKENWDFLEIQFEEHMHYEVVPQGSAILRFQDQKVSEIADEARERFIPYGSNGEGYNILSANCPYLFASQVGEELYKRHPERPFVATYFDRADGKQQWSLRSSKTGIDVSEVAKEYGGGGHAHAAGFVMSQVVPMWKEDTRR